MYLAVTITITRAVSPPSGKFRQVLGQDSIPNLLSRAALAGRFTFAGSRVGVRTQVSLACHLK